MRSDNSNIKSILKSIGEPRGKVHVTYTLSCVSGGHSITSSGGGGDRLVKSGFATKEDNHYVLTLRCDGVYNPKQN